MKIDINTLTDALTDDKLKNSEIATLMLDYGILKNKIAAPESEQSFYFEKAEDSRLRKVEELKRRFDYIRNDVNSCDTDTLISNIETSQQRIAHLRTFTSARMIAQMGIGAAKKEIVYWQQILAVKSRVSKLEYLDFYMSHPKEMLKVLGW